MVNINPALLKTSLLVISSILFHSMRGLVT